MAQDGETIVAYGALVDDRHVVTAASVDLAEVAFARLGAEVVPVVQPEEFSSPIGEFLRLIPLERSVDGSLHKTVCLPERDEAGSIRYVPSDMSTNHAYLVHYSALKAKIFQFLISSHKLKYFDSLKLGSILG